MLLKVTCYILCLNEEEKVYDDDEKNNVYVVCGLQWFSSYYLAS